MRKAFILSIAVGVALTAPVAAHQRVSGHRTHHWYALGNATALAPPQVDPPRYTTSHGRLPPTTGAIFTRNAGDCNRLLCIGI